MKKLAIGLAATTLVLGVVALNQRRALGTAGERQQSLEAQALELEQAQKTALLPAAPAVPVSHTAGPAAPATPAEAPSAPVAAAARGQRDRSNTLAEVTQVMASPEAQEMMRNQVRGELQRQFPDLAVELNLSPAEAEKLMDLIVRQGTETMGDAFGMLGGDSKTRQDSQRKMMDRQLANEAELKALLGSRYPEWQDYQGTIAARQQVTQLRAMLGPGDNALGEAQVKPLTAALGAETARINEEMRSKMTSPSGSENVLLEQVQYMADQNHRLIKAASSHLTAAQLDGYRRMLKQQEDMTRMMLGSMNGPERGTGQGGVP